MYPRAFKTNKIGKIKDLRGYIGEGYEMTEPNHLYWITDRNPYETFPCCTKSTIRQYFQLVTSEVGEWCEYIPLKIHSELYQIQPLLKQ